MALSPMSRMYWIFLSTPSARRATVLCQPVHGFSVGISIHALREEGDR